MSETDDNAQGDIYKISGLALMSVCLTALSALLILILIIVCASENGEIIDPYFCIIIIWLPFFVGLLSICALVQRYFARRRLSLLGFVGIVYASLWLLLVALAKLSDFD